MTGQGRHVAGAALVPTQTLCMIARWRAQLGLKLRQRRPEIGKRTNMNIWKGSVRVLAALAVMAAIAPRAVPAADDDAVLAIVDGEEITRADVMVARNRLPAQIRELPEEQILPILINVVIDSRLIANQAREEGIADEPEIKAQVELVQEMVLEQTLLTRHLQDRITEEALRERYAEAMENEEAREQVRARHILVAERSEAEEAIRRLDEGDDFETVAEELSADPSAQAGGDLGYFSRGDMIPAFAEVAFALEPGTYTQTPVQTEFGWHVIKVEDRRIVDPPPFEQVREQLQQQMAMELRNEYVQQLREQAEITKLYEAPLPQEAPEGTLPEETPPAAPPQ
jgi:peptidyl-prolyl cis-trans isomerase C